jgi:hypothetical protein
MDSFDDRDGGRFSAPFYNFQTPPSHAGSNPPARVYAGGGPARSPYERFIDGDDRDAAMYDAMQRNKYRPLPAPHSWREMPNTGRSLKEAGRRLMNVDTSIEPEDLARMGVGVAQFLAPDATRFTKEIGPVGAPLDVANVVTSASGKLPALAIQGGLGIWDTLMSPSEDSGPATPQELPPEVGMRGRGFADGGKVAKGLMRMIRDEMGKRPEIVWHGSPSGDLRGGSYGLHVGTEEAAKQALEARIGRPADPPDIGTWDGTRRLGDTLLKGQPEYGIPDHMYGSEGRLSSYSNSDPIPRDVRPSVDPYHLVGSMVNTRLNPYEDFQANGRMAGNIKRGNARRGIYYGNISEDEGSISAALPSAKHLEPIDIPDEFQPYADGGKVAKAIRTIRNSFGSLQGARMEQAADLANLDRYSTKGLLDTFSPTGEGRNSLYTTLPPYAFEDYAKQLPNGATDKVPYPRWDNQPSFPKRGRRIRNSTQDALEDLDEPTYDNYIDRLANHIRSNGMDTPPELWMYKTIGEGGTELPSSHPFAGVPAGGEPLPQGMTAIEGHEGRHRMRAMDRMGDQSSLVRLNNVNPREFGRDPVEEAVERMQQKYLPQGANTPILPEDLYESGRPPLRLGSEAFEKGGVVEYHADLGPVGKGLTTLLRDTVGKPNTVKLPGGFQMPARPIKEFEDVAHKFATRYGNEYPITSYPKLDEDRARKIAQGYEDMRHDPSDPRVKRAYDALIDETMDQYRALEGTGAKFEFLKPGEGDPYAASPSLGYRDLVQNGRLKVFPTEQGYGTQTDISDNPLLKRVGRVGDLDNATANDAFRVVHDALGHFGPGNPFFRAPGEERAWLNHMRSYSPDAVPAATSETRGQNSWVNFGPQSATNKGASGADTVYADQKAGLLPEWMWDPNGSDVEHHKDLGPVGQAIGRAAKYLIDPARESFPGIYKPPPELVSDARSRLIADPGQEGNMYKLFGHTRNSLDELSQGNRDLDSIRPFLQTHPFNLSGTASSSSRALTNPNAARLRGALSAGLADPDIKLTRSWYEMSPLWDRMRELGTGDRAMTDLNNRTAVMSAGSDPKTEINRGFYANWLAKHGRLDDFVRYGGVPEHERLSGDFPEELMGLQGHAYHGTAQVPNLLDYEHTGRLWPANHKVPTYAAATDPHFPYSDRPIADSHFNRILGFPDVSTATTDAVRRGVPSNTEYSDIVPWFNDKVAGRLGMRPRDAQALLWNLGGPQTGVRYIGPSKLEMIANHMADVAERRGIHPEEARDLLLSGEIGGSSGGTRMPPRGATMSVPDMSGIKDAPYDFSQIPEPNARGGKIDDDMLGWKSMFFDAHGGEIGHGYFGSKI